MFTKTYTDLELRIRDFGRRVTAHEEGAGMVEYALLVALIGVLLIGAIGVLTTAIGGAFGSASDAL